ncbi:MULTISPECIES: amino acid ABC transporter permease [Brevibacterium]|nr:MULTISPECIES: amino acid ABC transporter permease [Brevibacterium]
MAQHPADLAESINKPRITRKTKTEKTAWVVLAVVAVVIAHTLISNPNFEWATVGRYFFGFPVLKGLLLTIILTIVSMALGTLIGLVLAVLKIMNITPITILVDLYLTFFRGTPILVQLIFWFNIAALFPDLFLGIPFTGIGWEINVNAIMTPLVAAVIGLSLNEGAYTAENIRGGFLSVGKGQLEAADSLGFSEWTKITRIIIPQSLPTIIPATGNRLIGMFKETTLVSVLGVADLLQSVQLIYSRNYETIPLLIVACLWYLIITLALSYPQKKIEDRYSKHKNSGGKVTATSEGVKLG